MGLGPGLLITTIAQAVLVVIATIQGYAVGWLVVIGVLGLVQLFILISMGFAIDELRRGASGARNQEQGRQQRRQPQPSIPSLDMPNAPMHRREAAMDCIRRALAAATAANTASAETATDAPDFSRAAKQAAETALSAVGNLRAMVNSGSDVSFQNYIARTDSAAKAANDAAKAAREAVGKD